MKDEKKSVVVALTGGIGTGKSSVANILRKKGVVSISTDLIAKRVMIENQDVINEMKSNFGDDIYLPDGNVDKVKLAKTVFGSSEQNKLALDKLNQIVHPRVIEKMIELVEQYEKAGEKIIVVESALIFEAGLEDGFDYIITVFTDEDKVIERIKERFGLSTEEAYARIKSQLSQKEKAEMSDFIIENNSGFDDLIKAVEFVYSVLINL